MRSKITKSKIIIRNPDHIRPWQHVLDPIIGYLQLGEYVHKENNYKMISLNFGPTTKEKKSVRDIVKEISKNAKFIIPSIMIIKNFMKQII